MKNFKHFIVACGLWSLAWLGLVQPVTWVANLFAFITWASLLLFINGHYNKEVRARIHQSYRDVKHAPVWFDCLAYGAIILMCAAMAHYGKAAAWLFMLSTDLGHRAVERRCIMNHFRTVLGTNHKKPRSRIWLEGKRLVEAGFTVGTR